MHVGDGAWVLVDSCGRTDAPSALEYLGILGVDPGEAVKLIVASHWHDDHIRGIAQMAAVCRKAKFCCSNVLCADEFLGVVHALENRHFAASSSGVREIYSVFSRLLRRIRYGEDRRGSSNSQGAVERTIGESGIRLQLTTEASAGCRSTTSSDRSAHAMAGRIAGSRVPSEGVHSRVTSVRA